MKDSKILGVIGFYGAIFAFIYYSERYATTVFAVWAGVSAYYWYRSRKDEDYLEKLPTFFHGIVAFAVGSFIVTMSILALVLLIFLLFSGSRE